MTSLSPLLLAFVRGDGYQAKPCGLPRGQHNPSLRHFPFTVLVTLFSRLTRATPARSLPSSWTLAKVLNPIPRTACPVSHSTSLNQAPLKTRVQGCFPGSCQSAQAHSCHSLGIWSLSSRTPTWHQPGHHPGRGQRPLGPPGSARSSLRSTPSPDPCGGAREEVRQCGSKTVRQCLVTTPHRHLTNRGSQAQTMQQLLLLMKK